MAYMKDLAGRRLDTFEVADRERVDAVVRSVPGRAAACTIGDSITASGWPGTQGRYGPSWWTFFQILTGSRVRFDAVYATAGYTIQQIRDTHLPTVLAHSPKYGSCWIMAGTNNMLSAWDLPAMKLAYAEICDTLVDAGILPVIVTIPPNNGTSEKRQRITIWNAYLRNYAQIEGFPILDAHSVLTDPATGAFKAGYYDDDDHPSNTGRRAIGGLAAADTQLVSRFPLGQPYLTHGADDGVNLAAGGLFTTDTSADGVGNSWLNGVGAFGTPSLVADASVLGQFQRIRKTSGQTGSALIYQDITVGAALTSITATAATDVFTKNAHGMSDGQRVMFSTVVGGTSLNTSYYVRDVTTNTFKLALTLGGAAIDVPSDGTGGALYVATRWNAGDQIQLSGRIRNVGETDAAAITSLGAAATFQVQMGAVTVSPINNTSAPFDGIATAFGVMPADADDVRIQIICNGTATQDMHLDVGQVSLINLTQLGIAL